MKIKNSVSLGLFFVVLLMAPSSAFAYFTTSQTALRLNNETILYTVTYRFGTEKYDMLLPIAALRKGVSTQSTDHLEYSLLSGDKEVMAEGKSNAFVLSNAEIKDNQYFIPKGESRVLMLVALVNLPNENQNNVNKLSLQVSALPFVLNDGKKAFKNGLNPSELQYYITPEIKF